VGGKEVFPGGGKIIMGAYEYRYLDIGLCTRIQEGKG
jgi:hypothetical protein